MKMVHFLFSKGTSTLSDDELMHRIAAKSCERAFDELYHRHSRRLMGFLLRQLRGDEERAADLTQDTFMRVWANRERYRHDRDFKTWLFCIAYNLVKNEYRRTGHSDAYIHHALYTQVEEQDDDIEIKIDDKALDQALQKELCKLDAHSRMLFSLRYEEEMTVSQIAQIMEIPEGTVKSRQHTLIRILKEKLKHYEDRR